MTAQHVGFFVPHAIGLVAAAVVTLIGFRKIGPKLGKHAGADRWHARFGPYFRIGGPLLVVAVLALAIVAPASDWTRHTTTDGACSAEFPRPPRHETQTHADVPTDTLELEFEGENARFSLSFSDLSAKDAALPSDELFALLRGVYATTRTPVGAPARLMKEQVLEDRGFPGREYQFAVEDQLVTRIKVFVSGRRVYRAIAVNPPGADADRAAQRFIDSFRFEKP